MVNNNYCGDIGVIGDGDGDYLQGINGPPDVSSNTLSQVFQGSFLWQPGYMQFPGDLGVLRSFQEKPEF